jgi:hypothetical protein
MLTDIERKVLRIIVNFSKNRGRFPRYDELILKTGRDKKGIRQAIKGIEQKMQIDWKEFNPNQVLLQLEVEFKPKFKPKFKLWNRADFN